MASTPEKKEESEGPIARTITFFGWVPVMMNPPMRTLSAVSTRRRVEIFPNKLPDGVTVGVALGATVDVAEGVAVGVVVGLAVAVGLGEGVGVAVAVAVGVAVALGEAVGVGPIALIVKPVSFTKVA